MRPILFSCTTLLVCYLAFPASRASAIPQSNMQRITLKGCGISFDAPVISAPWQVIEDGASGSCKVMLRTQVDGHNPVARFADYFEISLSIKVRETCDANHKLNASMGFQVATPAFLPPDWYPRTIELISVGRLHKVCVDLPEGQFSGTVGFAFSDIKSSEHAAIRGFLANVGNAMRARSSANASTSPARPPAPAPAPRPAPPQYTPPVRTTPPATTAPGPPAAAKPNPATTPPPAANPAPAPRPAPSSGSVEWKEFRSETGRFVAQFPKQPSYQSWEDNENFVSHEFQAIILGGQGSLVKYADLPQELMARGADGVMDFFRRRWANHGEISNERRMTCGEHPGRRFVVMRDLADLGPGWHAVQVCLAQTRVYQVISSGAGQWPPDTAWRLQDSFRILPGP